MMNDQVNPEMMRKMRERASAVIGEEGFPSNENSNDHNETICIPALTGIHEQHNYSICSWLQQYIKFSELWSPQGYKYFHEAIGLWLLSVIIAKRVITHLGGARHTGLFIMLNGHTGLFAKTTTTQIALEILTRCGLKFLLLPDTITPQKFIYDYVPRMPFNYDKLTFEKKREAEIRAGFSSKRGWYYDEFGQHIQSMMKETGFMSEFRSMFRRIDDNKADISNSTISRGLDEASDPYLALLGNLTPRDLKPYARKGATLWGDGFLARFAIVTPPAKCEASRQKFPDGERVIPYDLLEPLRMMHERLGFPDVHVTTIPAKKKNDNPTYEVNVSSYPITNISLNQGVIDRYYDYYYRLRACIEKELIPDDLYGNYVRFHEKALRVAMIITSINDMDIIDVQTWELAESITERWRISLHESYEQVTKIDVEEEMEDSATKKSVTGNIYQVLHRNTGKSMTANDIRRYVRNATVTEIEERLSYMINKGMVLISKENKGTKYYEIDISY